MDITIAYFHPFFHPEVVKRDFEEIRAAGANNLVCALHEQEEQRWSRDLERGLRLAHDVGLKVYLSPGRFGNLFAGPTFMPSWFTFHHLQSRVKDRHGRTHDASCFNHQPFRTWLYEEIEHLVKAYDFNGIIIDEPRGADITCFCSVCRALCPDVTDLPRFRRRSLIEFLGELCACSKRARPDIRTTIALLPQDLAQADDIAALPHLDTLGCHLFSQLLGEDIDKVKEWGIEVTQATRKYNKRSQLWLQNFSLSEDDEKQLELSFNKIMSTEPDEIACYYYWRNNADPAQVWQNTRKLLRRAPRRQLHWQSTLTRIPVPPLTTGDIQKTRFIEN